MIKIKPNLNLDNIHKKLSQEEIWSYLVDYKNINKPFKMRKEEDHPSCTICYGTRGDLLMKDWGDPNQLKPETWYQFLQRTKYYSYNNSFIRCLAEVNEAFNLNLVKPRFDVICNKVLIKNVPKIQDNPIEVEIKIKAKIKGNSIYYSNEDLSYWKQYGISKKKLKEKLVIPITTYWINDKAINIGNYLAYAYIGLGNNLKGIEAIKIYAPNKYWFGNTDKSLIFNKNFIQPGELLIIQTSLKDIMCMEELGYINIIAPNSENTIFSTNIWTKLNTDYKHKIYFANNDFNKNPNPGIEYAKQWKEKYNISYIHTPDNTTSDISDYRKIYGEYKTKELLNNLLCSF